MGNALEKRLSSLRRNRFYRRRRSGAMGSASRISGRLATGSV